MIGRRSHDDAQSFEDAFNGGTPRDEHIADLVRFAETICASAVVEPSTSFRTSLRTRLMTEAATTLVPMPAEPSRPAPVEPRAHPVRRRLAIVTAGLVAVGGGVGLVTSSASALPGDMLYPVKRTVESVELQLHRDDASRGSFQLSRAAERLAEARQLNADGGSTTLIVETLDDFSTTAEDGSTKLFSEFSATGEEKSIRQVNDFIAASSVDLSELSAQLPDGAADSFAAAKAAVTHLATEASTLCGSCAPADVLPLVKSVGDAADDEPAKKTPAKRSDNPADSGKGSTSGPGTTVVPTPAAPVTPRPADTAAPTIPVPKPTPKAPSLTDVTDPLLGGLLGDETQEGLVPGLLNGLLGNQTPKP